jgi:hypothetical protein
MVLALHDRSLDLYSAAVFLCGAVGERSFVAWPRRFTVWIYIHTSLR